MTKDNPIPDDILPTSSSSEIIAWLHRYDVVLVPSQWLETGPPIVLETFAARTPVSGPNLGGIGELVTDGFDGLLVQSAAFSAAWRDLLRQVCFDPDVLSSLLAGIRPPRRSHQVALEMLPIYGDIAGNAIAPSRDRASLVAMRSGT